MTKLHFIYLIFLLVCGSFPQVVTAQEVSVTITTDESYSNPTVIEKIQYNLSQTLSEINRAQKENRPLNTVGLALDAFAQKSLSMLWANVHFYCDDSEIVERCWVFDNGQEFMVSHIPLIIEVEGGGFGDGTYQEAVVDFDQQGRIKDFRFSLGGVGESMENCGTVANIERKMQILTYCERFRTAYNQKDMEFLKSIFSDDALIITGNVVMTRPASDMFSAKLKVTYKKQTKEEYLANLRRAFLRNKWIDVKFSEIGENGKEGSCSGITQSKINPNMYGVRLRQEWRSSNYSDTGYIFLLWDFADDKKPVIHVRTWQPEWAGDTHLDPDDSISSLGGFDL